MRNCFQILILILLFHCHCAIMSQTDSVITGEESANNSVRIDDTNEIELQQTEASSRRSRIDSLRKIVHGYPVILNSKDTLFVIHSHIGEFSPKERAARITKRINNLMRDEFLIIDSIIVVRSHSTYEIVYDGTIIMSVSESDAMWYDKSAFNLANELCIIIQESILKAKKDRSLSMIFQRIGLALIVILILGLLMWLIGRGKTLLLQYINSNHDRLFKKLSYKDYTFLTAERGIQLSLLIIKSARWFIYALLFYISLPIIFSIFPFSRNWSYSLITFIWSPFKGILHAVWDYLPNLFTILVIYFVIRFFIRFIKYIFTEIGVEKLKIPGFYYDWAMPTFSIVKFLLYAFMLVLIYPYLPASDSDIFKGVSIFIGVLLSLGSSSAIGNMMAGLMTTYMRPFKIGDRISISDVSGEVVEKTLLVTRLKTSKNEIVTIPNSSILSGNTINYTIEAKEKGLIIHTTVTIGYDVPWKDVHQALIEAALRGEMILKEPKPFVFQTSLDDFFVSYQINAYTKEANKQGSVYSNLHQQIQNVFNEKGIEILSPHYRADRDGNMTTIPSQRMSNGDKEQKLQS